jgi:hypothetical protein
MAEADELAKLAPDVLVTQRGQGQAREFVLDRLVGIKRYTYSVRPSDGELGMVVSQMMRTVQPSGGQGGSGNSGNASGGLR